MVTCAPHAYRFQRAEDLEHIDYENNTPLLVDAKKKIYISMM